MRQRAEKFKDGESSIDETDIKETDREKETMQTRSSRKIGRHKITYSDALKTGCD